MFNMMANVTFLGALVVIVCVIGIFHKKLWRNFTAVIDWIEACGSGLIIPLIVVWAYMSYATMWVTPVIAGLFLAGLVVASD